MLLSLRELELGKVHFDQRFQLEELALDEPGVEIPGGVRLVGDAELASEYTGEIRIRGQMEGEAKAPCDRCLETITLPLTGPLRLSFEPRGGELAEGEIELTDADAELGYYEGNGLELADVAREQVLLALPMQKLCRLDCQGICPICGQNRNEATCQCVSTKVDERWAALKNLR